MDTDNMLKQPNRDLFRISIQPSAGFWHFPQNNDIPRILSKLRWFMDSCYILLPVNVGI